MPSADSLERLNTKNTKPHSYGTGLIPSPAVAPRPVPQNPPPPVPVWQPQQQAPQGGGYGGGGGGGSYGGSYAPAPAPPPEPPKPSQTDFIAADAGYKAQRDALAKALQDYEANYTAELSTYDQDYNKGIRNLGYNAPVADDPKTPDIDESKPGGWDTTDTTRASGRSYQNQLNQFASNGTLQSSLYAQAVSDLMRSLEDQRGTIDQARTNFRDEKTRAKTSFATDNTSQKNLAYADAAARYAALYGA